jgi:hypothetical protein
MAYIKVLYLLVGYMGHPPQQEKEENKSYDRRNAAKEQNIYNYITFSPNKSTIARQVTVFCA